MTLRIATICVIALSAGSLQAMEYPDMTGSWQGEVRTVSSGEQVRSQVASGGAVIDTVNLTFTVSHQDGEAFIGESMSDAPGAEPVPVWGAIRSTGQEAVFVTGNGGRGQLWFTSRAQFEFCFANQTPEAMSAYCAVLVKAD